MATARKDPAPFFQSAPTFVLVRTSKHMLEKAKHIAYVQSLDSRRDELQYWYSAHLRMSGLYWGYTSLHLLGAPDGLNSADITQFVLSCYHDNGGFGAHPGHDPHLLYTLSALQILLMTGDLNKIDRQKTTQFVLSMQLPDGSFQGDEYGEIDSRFVYTAIQSLAILKQLDKIKPQTVEWLSACQNFDGGFGLVPKAESHSAQAFVVLAALDILGRVDAIRADAAAWWLSERQTPSGGLNGRPEKLPDVCYSWWVLSSLAILGRLDWINGEKLKEFIYAAQDENGGIADRDGNEPDVFHTVFGLAGLSLLGYDNLVEIDPTFCLPKKLTNGLKLSL